MRIAILLLLGVHTALISSCQQKAMPDYTNHLIHESSPYLLQHAHNPVDWYPWSNKALELAKAQNKLLIISVGYAACHWCHVMEHESFEDTTVANLMNKFYISIKVDREERPDVDQVYMDAAQVLTGRGGWPLNVIALPDGRPIYAGTYFTKEQWIKVLKGVHDFYDKTPEKAIEQAMLVSSGVGKMSILPKADKKEFVREELDSAAEDWLNSMDMRDGGRRGRMKFPMPKAYLVLLNYAIQDKNKRAEETVLLTLDKMAMGGIYDQVGGGFSRYSVDPYWHVPHFEKMLYDNAQLISLYSDAFKHTKNPIYREVVEETISFCDRELSSDEGSYLSSLDADSEGEEGKFYVWTESEIDQLLESNSKIFKTYYGITKNGNWESGNNVLKISSSIQELSETYALDKGNIEDILSESKDILFNARENRVRPALDDKVLTSWNGLMITGLAKAYEALGNEQYKEKALAIGEFIWDKMWTGDYLYRSRKNNRSSINAFLEDYAFSIMGFIDLYQVTFDELWLQRGQELVEILIKNYFDVESGLFRFKSVKDDPLYVKKVVIEDNVIPSGNSAMAINLFRLGNLLSNNEYLSLSKNMLSTSTSSALEHASYYYNWFDLYQMHLNESVEIVVAGDNYNYLRKQLSKSFLPNIQLAGGNMEGIVDLLKGRIVDGKTMIYVCKNKTCKLPTEDIKIALKLVGEEL